jgi:hypothetical protein
MIPLHLLQAVIDDGQIVEPKEIHLQETEGFAGWVVKLRDDRPILIAPQRDMVNQRLCRDDDTGSVHAGLPD